MVIYHRSFLFGCVTPAARFKRFRTRVPIHFTGMAKVNMMGYAKEGRGFGVVGVWPPKRHRHVSFFCPTMQPSEKSKGDWQVMGLLEDWLFARSH